MRTLIAKLDNGTEIVFDAGKFDNWCVYIVKDGKRQAPRDTEYFEFFAELAKKFSREKVYADFIKIYNKTTCSLDEKVVKLISRVSKTYDDSQQEIEKWFIIIYAGMIAEENKKYAVLKKRVKRLGIHTLLFEEKSADYSANFLRGVKWRKLDLLCKSYGF